MKVTVNSIEAREMILAGNVAYKLNINGGLNLAGCTNLTSLPDGLQVRGWLDLTNCRSLVSLPDNLQVNGSLDLAGCESLTTLPDGFQLEGWLNLEGCKSLTSLGQGLRVGDNLHLENCLSLQALPSDLLVGGNLVLVGCIHLVKLPEDLQVGGNLILEGCTEITTLPQNLQIGGWLVLRDCNQFTTLPGNLVAHGLQLEGKFNISNLPKDMKLGWISLDEANKQIFTPDLLRYRVLYKDVVVDPAILVYPERLTADVILNEPNAEVRRVMIERIGNERFVELVQPTVIHEDVWDGGVRKLYRIDLAGDSEPYVAVSVTDPSTGRGYILRVPPHITTCHEAVAWTFNEPPDRYAPVSES
jgi:hypothetical protein